MEGEFIEIDQVNSKELNPDEYKYDFLPADDSYPPIDGVYYYDGNGEDSKPCMVGCLGCMLNSIIVNEAKKKQEQEEYIRFIKAYNHWCSIDNDVELYAELFYARTQAEEKEQHDEKYLRLIDVFMQKKEEKKEKMKIEKKDNIVQKKSVVRKEEEEIMVDDESEEEDSFWYGWYKTNKFKREKQRSKVSCSKKNRSSSKK